MKLFTFLRLITSAFILISMPCNAATPDKNGDVPPKRTSASAVSGIPQHNEGDVTKRARTGASTASSFGDTTAQAVATVVPTHAELIDEFAELGHGWAIRFKALLNPATAKDFIEKRITLGCETAINLKITGLCRKLYGYEDDITEARRLNDDLVAQGNVTAINFKIHGLTQGNPCYEIDITEARSLNEGLVAQGTVTAINFKIQGLMQGKPCYENITEARRFIAEARRLNDGLAAQGNDTAIHLKSHDLVFGGIIYSRNLAEAVAFLRELQRPLYVLK